MGLFSWLGQLVSRTPRPGAQAERRLWVRIPCQLQADCTSTGKASGARSSVKVTDVSRGGCRLVMSEPIEPGALLSVEIPGEAHTVLLVYVIRVTARPGGEWEVGCTFATEIDTDELRQLGGEKLKPDPGDRRAWERTACEKPILYQSVGGDFPRWSPATVMDVSAGGVALRVDQPVDLRSVLRLELCGGGWPSATVLLASVVRTTELDGGRWLLGCNFLRELDEEELESLVEKGST